MRILYYLPKSTVSRIDKAWLYGRDIIGILKVRHPEWEFVEVDGSQRIIYKNIDVYLRPNRHDGIAKMVKEAKMRKIPVIWSYEKGYYREPNVDEIERRLIGLEKVLCRSDF